MATLTNGDRQEILASWMRDNESPVGSLTKAEVKAAVDAIDQWISDNAASFNSSIPLPARTVLTSAQKVHIFTLIAHRRFVAGV